MQNANPIGHNQPPSDVELLQENLAGKHSEVLTGAQRLIEAAERIPTEITDDETAGKAADFIKMVTGCAKNIESLRVSEKEPHLNLGRMVDGFFKRPADALQAAKMKAMRPLDAYTKAKEAAERKRLQDEALALRQKQDEQARAAQMLEAAKMVPEAEAMLTQATITEQVVAKVEQQAQAKPADITHTRGASGARAALRTVWVGEIFDVGSLDLQALRFHINPDALQKAVNSFVAAGGRQIHGAKIYEKSETVVR